MGGRLFWVVVWSGREDGRFVFWIDREDMQLLRIQQGDQTGLLRHWKRGWACSAVGCRWFPDARPLCRSVEGGDSSCHGNATNYYPCALFLHSTWVSAECHCVLVWYWIHQSSHVPHPSRTRDAGNCSTCLWVRFQECWWSSTTYVFCIRCFYGAWSAGSWCYQASPKRDGGDSNSCNRMKKDQSEGKLHHN